MNCQIKKVIVSISSLGSKLSGEHLTVHVYASNEAEKLLVGRVDFMGKTDADFKCSLNVICPDGFTLTAIVVDEYGIPHPFGDNYAVTVSVDLHYLSGGFLTPEKDMKKELSRDAVQAIVGRYLTGAATEYADDMINELMALHTVSTISDPVDSGFARRPPRSVRELVIKASVDTSELQLAIDEVLDSIRKSDVFKILSGQFVEKPTGNVQQSVVFMADRFKVTDGPSASGEPTTEQLANAIIEAAKAGRARQEAMMADLASAQAALTEHINQVVNDAITNALKPGGALYAFRTRT